MNEQIEMMALKSEVEAAYGEHFDNINYQKNGFTFSIGIFKKGAIYYAMWGGGLNPMKAIVGEGASAINAAKNLMEVLGV